MDTGTVDPLQLLETLHEGVVVHGSDTQILYANPRALELLRLTEDQALGRDVRDDQWHFIDSLYQTLPMAEYPVKRVLLERQPLFNLEVGICDSSIQRVTWVLCNAFPQFNEQGLIHKVVVTLLDISAQKKSIPFEGIIAHANDAVVVTNAQPLKGSGPQIVYVNQAFTDLTEYSPADIIGKTPRVLQGPQTDIHARKRIAMALQKQAPIREQILNYTQSGKPYWVELNIVPLTNEQGEINFYAAIERDITAQKDYEAQLTHWAHRDPLTGLLNRRRFEEAARQAVSRICERGGDITLAILDLDYFKKVNDNYGHGTGDQVLKGFAQLLKTSLRSSDLIGRMGGEEFMVLLPGVDGPTAARKLEEFRLKLAAQIFQPENGDRLRVTVSTGFCTFTAGAHTLESVMGYADQALYQAKAAGRNRVQQFDI